MQAQDVTITPQDTFQPMPGLISCAGVWEVGTTTSSKCSRQNASLSLLDHGDPLWLQSFLNNET